MQYSHGNIAAIPLNMTIQENHVTTRGTFIISSNTY